jgi:F-type H+-transporting ATPase subunit delta
MAHDIVARRYAQALIEVAAEFSAVEAIGQDLHRLSSLLDAHGGILREALSSPVFTAEERSGVLEALMPRMSLHPLTANLMRLANEKGRLRALPAIAEAYGELADLAAGRQRVEVITAEPMSPQVEAEVRAALERSTGKIVRLSTKVDASLIGGMVAKVGGTVYDSSIRNRLEQLKSSLFARETAIA